MRLLGGGCWVLGVCSLMLAAGCTSIDCSVYGTSAANYEFVMAENDTVGGKGMSVSVLTSRNDSAEDTLLLLVNDQDVSRQLSVPVSVANGRDELYFILMKKSDAGRDTLAVDTIVLEKTNVPVFEGVDCDPRYNHKVQSITTTGQFIETIEIKDKSIDEDPAKVHFYLKLRNFTK